MQREFACQVKNCLANMAWIFLAMCAYLVKQFLLGLDSFTVLSTNVSWSFSSWYHLWLLIMHQKFRQVHKMHWIAETASLLPTFVLGFLSQHM